MRKILNSNAFLAFLAIILSSIVIFILYQDFELKKNIEIFTRCLKNESELVALEGNFKEIQEEMKKNESSATGKDILEDGNTAESNEPEKSELTENKDENTVEDYCKIIEKKKDDFNNKVLEIYPKKISKKERDILINLNKDIEDFISKYSTIHSSLYVEDSGTPLTKAESKNTIEEKKEFPTTKF